MPVENAPTAAEREELRELHCRSRSYLGNEGRVCEECLGDYPCVYVRTLDALEASERERDALVAREDALVESVTALVEHVSGSCVGDRVQRAIWMMPAKWLHDAAVSQAAYNAITAAVAAYDARRKESDHE